MPIPMPVKEFQSRLRARIIQIREYAHRMLILDGESREYHRAVGRIKGLEFALSNSQYLTREIFDDWIEEFLTTKTELRNLHDSVKENIRRKNRPGI